MRARRWTPEEDATLRRLWGTVGTKPMRAALPGRTLVAIYGRAKALRLPAQSTGLTSVKAAGDHLGITGWAVQRLAAECGLRLELRAPVQSKRRGARATVRHAGVDLDQIEELYRARLRCVSHAGYERARGLSPETVRRALLRAGVPSGASRGTLCRVPEGVLDEVVAERPGPWCTLWRRVLAVEDRPCAPWLLAIATWDIREAHEGRGDAEWTELWLPGAVRAAARELAGVARRETERAA